MVQKFSVPRGTSDILPPDIPVWQDIEAKARQVIQNYGYKEIRTPIFEETELFVRSMGHSSDIVQKQMLTIASQKQESAEEAMGGLSLRPESTASIVRAYIQNSLDRKEGLSKLFYIGPMFRGERPQKGRLRQFHQIGVEAIGPDSSHPYLDAEVIALSINILKGLGLKDFQVKINTLGSEEDKANFSKWLREKLQPDIKKLCPDCQQRFERNVFRILDCKNKDCKSVVGRLEIGYGHLSRQSQGHFDSVKKALSSLGIEYEEAPCLVRGLDYYTHTVFEITDASLGSQDALGAGGRYNNLVKQLGGPQVDAIGFALGIERIILALPKHEGPAAVALTAFIIAMDESAQSKAFEILNVLRCEDIASDMSYRVASMKSQMRLADKSGAPYVVIIGEDELKRDCVTLKNMEKGSQEAVDITNNNYSSLKTKLRERD